MLLLTSLTSQEEVETDRKAISGKVVIFSASLAPKLLRYLWSVDQIVTGKLSSFLSLAISRDFHLFQSQQNNLNDKN